MSFLEEPFTSFNIIAEFSEGKILMYTLATEKSTETITLLTEIMIDLLFEFCSFFEEFQQGPFVKACQLFFASWFPYLTANIFC